MSAALPLQSALDRALALIAAGFWIFPSWSKSRHVPGWPTRATRDAATVRAWFAPGGPYADCWPSIYTGKFGDGSRALLVVDVDPRGIAALDSLESLLCDTRIHKTPRGGFHGIYSVPFPGVKQGVNVLADGVDIRSKGGLIHFGEGYAIEQDAPIAEAPAALIEKCGGTASTTAPADRAQDRIAPDQEAAMQSAEAIMRTWPEIPEGERNAALRDFIYKVRESCATDAASTLLVGLAFAAERCAPPYPEDEARATIKSAIRSAQNAAGSKVALADDFAVVEVVDAVPADQPAKPDAQPTKGRRLLSMPELLARRNVRRPHLIKNTLLAGTFAELFGASGEAKTFCALDISHCIASEQRATWYGRPVAQGLVLYLALEGVGGITDRLQALAQEFGPAPDLYVADGGRYDLCAKEGREALKADIAATFGERRPVLIVVDTLARALALSGRDENSAQDIGLFNASVGALIAATGATLLVIHHSGKDRSKGARGSTALYAALDTELEAEGGRLAATKQRDLQEGPVLEFRLRTVVVGEDADGDQVTSCVIEAGAAQPQRWEPTGNTAHAWKALCDLSGAGNATVGRGALTQAFRARAYPAGDAKESTMRMALNRALGALVENGRIEGPAGGPWRRALTGG